MAEGNTFRRQDLLALRGLVIAMCEEHGHSGSCGPDCICQELLDEIDPKRSKDWKRLKYRKAKSSKAVKRGAR